MSMDSRQPVGYLAQMKWWAIEPTGSRLRR